MSAFEYRVIPAPRKGKSGKGVRGVPAKFANAMSGVMNEMGAEGWEYLRADTLPCEERQGLTGKTVKYHSMLVFRRPAGEVATETEEAAETLALPHHEEAEEEALEAVEETEVVEEADAEDGEEPPQRPHVAAE